MLNTAEAVSPSHPDKVCDVISDSILDECLKQDPDSRVAIEVLGGHGIVTVSGELTTKAFVDVHEIVQNVVGNKYGVQVNIVKQSPQIAQGVDKGGAGDQGIMIGYATRENAEMIPQELYLARSLCKFLYRRFPEDGKTQITLNENNEIKAIVASFCNVPSEQLGLAVRDWLGVKPRSKDMEIHVNPAGDWTQGGFEADTGLTGRKLACDNYGPQIPIGGGASCVDGETEYLGEDLLWHKIKDYKKGKIAEWTETGKIKFVKPKYIVSKNKENLYELKSQKSLSILCTINHRIPYITSKNNLQIKTLRELIDQTHISIPTYFYGFKGKGIELTDDEIRLQVAFCADGSIARKKGRLRIKKSYKKNRLVELLEKTDTAYSIGKAKERAEGYDYYYFKPPILEKSLYKCFKDINEHQAEVIAFEVLQWDGDRKGCFRTTNKVDADFVQFLFSVNDKISAHIIIDDRIGRFRNGYTTKSICYSVNRGRLKTVGTRRKNGNHIIPVFKKTDTVYCFTVPSSLWIMRRDNKICVTGNSGKDSSKVDRSAAYKARQLAVRLLRDHPEAQQAIVKLAYAIGVAKPVMASGMLLITETDRWEEIELPITDELTPKGIIDSLNLKTPIYSKVAEWGAYGNGFAWDNP